MKLKKKIESTKCKLRKICERETKKGNLENVLASLSTLAAIESLHNQDYSDFYIENKISELSTKNKIRTKQNKIETVLFYDGFGLDNRGLVRIYLRGLIKSGYRVLYITTAKDNNEQPNVIKDLNTNAEIYHLNTNSYSAHLYNLRKIFEEHEFQAAFFYSFPWDVASAVAFCDIEGKCNRYLINLTDHAFWIGTKSVDYCIEFRNYGASISHYYRNINLNQIIILPFYPIIDRTITFQGLPTKLQNKTFVFSGGSLYKTIDKEKTFYKIIDGIIKKHNDISFLYAGQGYDGPIKDLVNRHPERVYHINEREDLYEILKRAKIYINTYPISGGLMLQYAAMANCVPVTLRRKWDDDATGILREEETLNETFIDEDDFNKEIDRLLTDDDYLRYKQTLLCDQVISEKEFEEKLRRIVEEPECMSINCDLPIYNTEEFRKSYEELLTYRNITETIINKKNRSICLYFPVELLYKAIAKMDGFIKKISKKSDE